jgi:hypothetical protein
MVSALFKSRALSPVHLNQVGKYNVPNNTNEFYDVENSDLEEEKPMNEKKSTVKHRKKNKYETKYGYQYNGPYHEVSSKHYPYKRGSEQQMKSTVKCIRSPDVGHTRSTQDMLRTPNIKPKVSLPPSSPSKNLTERKPPKKIPPIPSNPQQLLITKNKTTASKPNIAARTKDLRLKGSDLYVARLGSWSLTPPLLPQSKYQRPIPDRPLPTPSPKSERSSLYDELSWLSRTPSPPAIPNTKQPVARQPEIRASRPCYRCVSAMHAVGIKRVFWTNTDGEWEGAKIRELVEALEMGEGEPGHDDGGDKGIFVTKHEVLMLKRIMGF